jgi:hypothetical protein
MKDPQLTAGHIVKSAHRIDHSHARSGPLRRKIESQSVHTEITAQEIFFESRRLYCG